MKKKVVFLLIVGLFLVGCQDIEETKDSDSSGSSSNIPSGVMIHQHCTRNGSLSGGEVELNYELYSTGEVLNRLESYEKVISSSGDILNTYEDAYNKIIKNYEGLEYYEASVIRENDYVLNTIKIDYDHIDIKKLLDIEGEEDNIIEDGTAKVDKWLELAKKFGTTCTEVKDS